jgi:hypothetical protein
MAVAAACPSVDSRDYFFPPGAIFANNRDGQDDFWRDWSARFLRSADLGSLSCGGTAETYRMLFLPASRPAVIVELGKTATDWRVVRIAFHDPRQARPGHTADPLAVSERTESRLANDAVAPFLVALEDAAFWTTPGYASSKAEDGHRWILEARKDGVHRVVTRHDTDAEPFKNASRALMRLTGTDIPEEMKR